MSRPPLPPFTLETAVTKVQENGLMRRRIASIHDAPIQETERKYHWPLGPRPQEHPSFSDLDF